MRESLRPLVSRSSHPAIDKLGWRVLQASNVTIRSKSGDISIDEFEDDFIADHTRIGRGNIGSGWDTLADAVADTFDVSLYGRQKYKVSETSSEEHDFLISGHATPRVTPITGDLADWLDAEQRIVWRDEPSGYRKTHPYWTTAEHSERQKWVGALTTPEHIERLTALYQPEDWRYWVEFVWRLKAYRHKWDNIGAALDYAETHGLRATTDALVAASDIGITNTVDIGDRDDEAEAIRSVVGRSDTGHR